MAKNKKVLQLSKLLAYLLGRRPDEFGLVPDRDGFFMIKEVLKAVCEEDGFGYVRRAHLKEILLTVPDPGFEIVENRIRASGPCLLPAPADTGDLPKLLYTCVRRRAYPHVLEKGIQPSSHSQVLLSDSQSLARRIGRRSDAEPVLLTVQVENARSRGVAFQSAGQRLFLAPAIPPPCFRGPALPKASDKPPTAPPEPELRRSATPGSFVIDIGNVAGSAGKIDRAKEGGRDARGRRKKNKPKREKPPWRR